jgi:hypothetical protein
MSTRIPANVRRGAALLDERLPGWRGRVSVSTLDLGNECKCVVGQVLGGYVEGTDLLGLETNRDAARYGFTTAARQTFDQLTAAWRKVLS